jgi:hypothetical protein
VIFAGRLGTYRYLDMHQAIGAALNLFETKVTPLLTGKAPEPEWQSSPLLVPSQLSINELVES